MSKVSLLIRDQWYSHACKILTDFDAKCKGFESRQVAHRKPLGGQMGKIMDKVKHNYNDWHITRSRAFFEELLKNIAELTK